MLGVQLCQDIRKELWRSGDGMPIVAVCVAPGTGFQMILLVTNLVQRFFAILADQTPISIMLIDRTSPSRKSRRRKGHVQTLFA